MEQISPYINYLLLLLLALGSVIYFRYSIAKSASEIQERVIKALESEVKALNMHIDEQDRATQNLESKVTSLNTHIDELEKDNTKLRQTLSISESEVRSLNDRINELEKDNTKLKQTLGIIKAALRKSKLTVDIDGNLVSIADSTTTVQTGRIAGTLQHQVAGE